ncbi:MAG: hypothetical protein IJV27_06825 [Prevotella sp.]|nr:hypothetical protein [Prevotella sp.]
MEAILVPLRRLLSDWEQSRVTDAINKFTCEKDPDIEFFLKERAIDFERISKSRTYLLCEREEFSKGRLAILGYFTLSLKSLALSKDLSVRQRKELDGFRGKLHGEPVQIISCYLIGQLAKNSAKSAALCGADILNAAVSLSNMAATITGGRWVLVECHDKPQLINFYNNNSFQRIETDQHGDMCQMIRRVGA